MNYEPGSVFKLNGKEYVLSENHTLDIPYGEDLWCLEYPSDYRFWEKHPSENGTGNPVPITIIDMKFQVANHYMLWLFKLGC